MKVLFLSYTGEYSVVDIKSENQDIIELVINSFVGGYTGYDVGTISVANGDTFNRDFRLAYADGIDVDYNYEFALNKNVENLFSETKYFDCVLFKGEPYTSNIKGLTDDDIKYIEERLHNES